MPTFWPDQLDYFEAVQAPEHCFADPDLRCARVTMDDLGMPRPWSGNFASVYQFQAADGQRTWAVKCFKHHVPDLNVRYQEISRCLRRADMPLTVVFDYLEQGIQVRGEWFPIVKMDWVEGRTLRQFVTDHLAEPHILRRLFDLWLKVETWLESAELAHGDLQHGNVLLVSAAQKNFAELKLVDYDGLWIPGLAGYPSHECGHSAYQHPRREPDQAYNPQIDRFPLLVIACALRCLSRPEAQALWQRYDNGDNLLFSKADFQEPGNSPLLRELWATRNSELRNWVVWLVSAAWAPLCETPALRELLIDGRLRQPAQQAFDAVARLFENTKATGPAVAAPVVEFAAIDDEVDAKDDSDAKDWSSIDDHVAFGSQDFARRRSDRRKSGGTRAVWTVLVLVLVTATTLIGRHYQGRRTAAPVAAAKPAPGRDGPAGIDGDEDNSRPQEKPVPVEAASAPAFVTPTDSFVGSAPGQLRHDNELKLPLAWCPPGDFQMGDSAAEGSVGPHHAQPVPVTLTQGFWLGEFEVTQLQWMRLMDSQPWQGAEEVKQGDGFPAVLISRAQAEEFCQELTAVEQAAGRLPAQCEYALPTEAQWEYACRAGSKTHFGFGNDAALLEDFGWYADNTVHINEPYAHETGLKRPNAWGIHDLHGNVLELCYDSFVDLLPGGQDPSVTFAGGSAVARGGSCDDREEECRSAHRESVSKPGTLLGFRVALVRRAAGSSATDPRDEVAHATDESDPSGPLAPQNKTKLESGEGSRAEKTAEKRRLDRNMAQ
ncbi:MAG TPA: SUMF1/EgtB/PvdO family nonheme iron enzyme [Planctomycetaceae bacterium]|jgi:formylglycine-generating enzyme required for sulfatase activity